MLCIRPIVQNAGLRSRIPVFPMKNSKLRRKIAWQAAQLMYSREESEYYRAKMKAARKIQKGWVKPADLPSNAEIRDEIQKMAIIMERDDRTDQLREMRVAALYLMQLLERFKPKIIGSVFTGHIRKGSDIDIHVFSDTLHAVTGELDYHNYRYEVTRKRVRKNGEETTYRHIHLHDRFDFELTVYPENKSGYVFKSSITGKAIERATVPQFCEFLSNTYPNLDVTMETNRIAEQIDPFQYFESLLLPLENVKQNPKYHPEGDALYHSLQVFDLACDQLPYDEEFLLAALLHDVGKAIEPLDHVISGLQALDGFITPRTHWLIENHMLAHKIADASIGSRRWRRLRENESYNELIMLGECDRGGRQTGVQTTDLDGALEYICSLSSSFG